MNQQLVGNTSALLLKQMDRTFQVDCVPEDDRSYHQCQTAGPIALIFEAPVAHFTQTIKDRHQVARISGDHFTRPS